MKSLAMPIGDLANWLEEEFNVPSKDTIAKWNELTGMGITLDGNCEEVNQTINIFKKNNLPTPLNENFCQHVFVAGNRKGQQCSTKPKGNKNRCSAHKLKDQTATPTSTKHSITKGKKQVESKGKRISSSDSESEQEEPTRDKSSKVQKKNASSDSETRTKQSPRKKSPKSQKVLSSDSESEEEKLRISSSDSESEQEEPTRNKSPKVQKKNALSDSKTRTKQSPRKKSRKVLSSDSESETSNESG